MTRFLERYLPLLLAVALPLGLPVVAHYALLAVLQPQARQDYLDYWAAVVLVGLFLLLRVASAVVSARRTSLIAGAARHRHGRP